MFSAANVLLGRTNWFLHPHQLQILTNKSSLIKEDFQFIYEIVSSSEDCTQLDNSLFFVQFIIARERFLQRTIFERNVRKEKSVSFIIYGNSYNDKSLMIIIFVNLIYFKNFNSSGFRFLCISFQIIFFLENSILKKNRNVNLSSEESIFLDRFYPKG